MCSSQIGRILLGMSDATTSAIAHLYRRAGFGLTNTIAQSIAVNGYQSAVDTLLNGAAPDPASNIPTPTPTPNHKAGAGPESLEERKARQQARAQQKRDIAVWWMQRMTATENPLREKMTLFWHGHFATSIDKVNEAAYMLSQNQIFRTMGLGTFEPMAQAVAKDPAMMIWLDANKNVKSSPNENFARELMELFTIGIGAYSDADVREAARAFTGWRVSNVGAFALRPKDFDGTSKTILGQTAAFTGEQVIALLVKHPAAAKFVVSKIWSRFASPVLPDASIVAELSPGFAADGDITKLLRILFNHPEFQSAATKQGLVKQPIEYVVSVFRAAGIGIADSRFFGPPVLKTLESLNQVPFDPPSVGGWPQNGYWLSTATSLARLKFATTVARNCDLAWLKGQSAPQRPATIADRLGIEAWSAGTQSALTKAGAPVDQFILALISPEFVLN
jgi:uncharacterized protein (DUF1800 family)